MAWIFLIIAGIFECAWAVGLRYTEGFTKLWPSIYTLAAMGVSIKFLSMAMKTIPMGTAYAIWTGIGAVGIASVGIFFYGESKEIPRLICIFLIIVGVIGLKVFSGHTVAE